MGEAGWGREGGRGGRFIIVMNSNECIVSVACCGLNRLSGSSQSFLLP